MGGKGLIVPKLCPICGHTGWSSTARESEEDSRARISSIRSSVRLGLAQALADSGDDDTGGSRLDFQQAARAVGPFLRSVLRRKHSLLHLPLGCEHVAFFVTVDGSKTFLHDTKDQAPISKEFRSDLRGVF